MKNDLKELHRLAKLMDYEDWRMEIQYRLTGSLNRIKNKELINKLPISNVCDNEVAFCTMEGQGFCPYEFNNGKCSYTGSCVNKQNKP